MDQEVENHIHINGHKLIHRLFPTDRKKAHTEELNLLLKGERTSVEACLILVSEKKEECSCGGRTMG